jgi:hypothetical protein
VSCSGSVLFSVEWFCFVAAALRRRVLHGGDLFGGAASTPLCFFSAPGHVVGSMSLGVCWWVRAAVASSSRRRWCIVVRLRVVVSRSQSDRPLSGARVDAPIKPGELFFLFFFVAWLWLPRVVVLYLSSISMKHALSCAVRLKKSNIIRSHFLH